MVRKCGREGAIGREPLVMMLFSLLATPLPILLKAATIKIAFVNLSKVQKNCLTTSKNQKKYFRLI